MSRTIRLAVDAMGGDHGPATMVEGAVRALAELGPSVELILVGQEDRLREAFASLPGGERNAPRVRFQHASEVVEMGEAPTAALRRKKDSSIRRVADIVAGGEADGAISAGSTGAVAATMAVVVGLIPGVHRAAIATILPTVSGHTLLLDVGANVDCKPAWLEQFAIMGRLYSQAILGRGEPTVGLLSIGEEESKGDERTRETHARLRAAHVGFVGNVEGQDILGGRADVVVCDGFVGNVVLKLAESFPPLLAQVLREEVSRSLVAGAGMWLARGALRRIWQRLDWESYGGAPLLGVDGACIICHGRSGPNAIRNAVRVAHEFVAHGVKERIRDELKGVA